MSDKNTVPYVPAEVRAGRLVRVCPVCHEQIAEHTDGEGFVSNMFVRHYETEHPAEPEPTPRRLYMLTPQGGPGDPQTLGELALDSARKVFPRDEFELQLIDRVEDLPEDAPVLQASDVLVAGLSDNPHERQIRWYKRDGERLVFTPTAKQHEAYDQATRRIMDARFVLLHRHRDELPKFTVADDIKGTDRALEAYEEFRTEVKPLEDAIMADLTAAQEAARHQFFTGRLEWLPTINGAIAAADVSEEEIDAQRRWSEAREAEIERATTKEEP
jgi:hypothetical protein